MFKMMVTYSIILTGYSVGHAVLTYILLLEEYCMTYRYNICKLHAVMLSSSCMIVKGFPVNGSLVSGTRWVLLNDGNIFRRMFKTVMHGITKILKGKGISSLQPIHLLIL